MIAAVYAQAPDPGSATSFGAAQNVDSAGTAHMRQDFYDTEGNLDAYREKDVGYGDTLGLTTNDTVSGAPLSAALPPGWVGSSVVSSDREAAAVVLVNYSGGALGTDGLTSADYAGTANPGSDIFCPSVGMRSAEATEITVMNTSGSNISDVSVSFTDRIGAAAGTAKTGESINAYAQKTYELFDSSFALSANFLGAARVQSTGGTPLAVVAVTHWGGGTFAYNCQPTDAAATALYAPKVMRRKPAWLGAWLDSSGVVAVNTAGTQATARVEFYDRDGNASGVFTDTIPAYSAHGYNTEYYGQADHDVIDGLVGTGTAANPNWLGSAVIKSVGSGGEKLVAIVKQGYENDLWAAGYNMLSDADAHTDWFFPLVYRRGFSQPWTDYAGLICQNVTVSSVTPQVTFVDRRATATSCTASTTVCQFTDATSLGQYVSHGYNTRYGGAQTGTWFGDPAAGATGNTLNGNFIGAAFVTASTPIVCIQETWMEEMHDGTAWQPGGDANLNNVYGK